MQDGIVIPATGPEAPPSATTNERPAWLPENFKSPEDLANSYKTLQAEYTKIKQGSAPAPKAPAPEAPKSPVADLKIDQAAADAVANAGLNFDSLADEFMAQGALKDESYKALEKAGIPKHLVDDYIALKSGEADRVRTEVISIAGGEDNFNQMKQWVQSGAYPDAEAYNRMITSGDPAQMRMAMTALKTAYANANGSDPSLVMGNGASMGGDVYRNDLEMVADMQKPEYRTDPAFRRQVAEKVARSMARK